MIESLRAFLLDYGQAVDDPAARKKIEEEIWDQFGAERTILVLDMSRFSLLTRRHGVVHYLSMVRRMQEAVRPIFYDNQGSVIRFEADNAFSIFPDPELGIRAAIELNRAIREENEKFPDDYEIGLSFGIDHGRILLVEDHDFYGDPVNTACKLGEDLAESGEILIANTAMAQLPAGSGISGKPVKFSLSGVDFEAVSIKP